MSTVVEEKDPDTDATYEIYIFEAFVVSALRSSPVVLSDLIRAPRDTGFYYQCTKAGRTATQYPESWPRVSGEVVADGSAEWTAVHPDDASPPIIQSVAWSVQDGMTIASQSDAGHIAQVTVSGGVDGNDYDATARITPTAGDPRDITITVPVRSQ